MEKVKGKEPYLIHMGETKRLPPIDADLKEQFVNDVEDRRGSAYGHLKEQTEKALREYMHASQGGDTHDRLTRIENKLDSLEGVLEESDSGGRTDSVSKTTERRIREIMEDIQQRAEDLDTSRVRENDLEAAIERNAGTSYKTVKRYKDLLTNQRELFPHPSNDGVYFIKPSSFIAYVEQNEPTDVADRVLEGYGADWWQENAPDGLLDAEPERGMH